MNNLFFWKNWHPSSRRVYLIFLGVWAAIIIAFVVIFPKEFLNIASWERVSELKEVPVSQDPITVGLFSFSYYLNYESVVETFLGSSLQLSPLPAYIFLLVIAVAWVVLLTIISALESFWYYVGVLLVFGVLLLFQLEQLLWFGQVQKFGVIIAFVVFVLPTFYFHQINPNHGLVTRLLLFTGATLLFAGAIALFAERSQPFLTLMYYGLGVPIALSVIFILIIGHELISFLTTLITQNNTPQSSRSLLHLSLLSLFYLINLGSLIMHNIGMIDWDILYLNAFWLLIFLSIIGIWGFRLREVQYKTLFSFAPLGGLCYLTLGIVTISTIVFLSWQGNDPMMESLEDCIVYSQLGFSFVFLLYLIANFIQPLMLNQQVYRVMYRPPILPYATALIGGAVATLGFFARANFFPYSQMLSGYYIGLGDLHWLDDDLFVAEQYYKLSDQYANNNHRANYSLGALAKQQGDNVLTAFYFQEALSKQPTALAYANAAAAYQDNNQYFDALFTLKKGTRVFPDNTYLQNNLGLAYGRTDILDSALYWLAGAREDSRTRSAAEANSLALITQHQNVIDVETDSILAEFVSDRNYPPSLINMLVLGGQQPHDSLNFPMQPNIPEDSVLTSFTYAQLRNYLIQTAHVDSSLVGSTEELTDLSVNFPYTEPLVLAAGQVHYRRNEIVEALKKLDRLQAVNVFKQNYYLDIMGLWALDQHAPRFATQFFAQLAERNYEDSRLKFAVSLTESLSSPDVSLDQAQQAWRQLLRDSTQSTYHQMAQQMLSVLTKTYSDLEMDIERYQWLRYRAGELSDEQLTTALQDIDDLNYSTVALYDLVVSDEDRYKQLVTSMVSQLKKQEGALNYQATLFLEWAWALTHIEPENIGNYAQRIRMLVPLTRWQEYDKTYLQALLARSQGDLTAANQLFARLLGNPYFEKGFVESVRYFFGEREEQAYQYWLDAIQTNPYSPRLLEEYIISALRMGLENYATESLDEYQGLVSVDRYQDFLDRFEAVRAETAISF